jgi:hypothetical protein
MSMNAFSGQTFPLGTRVLSLAAFLVAAIGFEESLVFAWNLVLRLLP